MGIAHTLFLSYLQQTLGERPREQELPRGFLLLVIAVERDLDASLIDVYDAPAAERLMEDGIARFKLVELLLRHRRLGLRLLLARVGFLRP